MRTTFGVAFRRLRDGGYLPRRSFVQRGGYDKTAVVTVEAPEHLFERWSVENLKSILKRAVLDVRGTTVAFFIRTECGSADALEVILDVLLENLSKEGFMPSWKEIHLWPDTGRGYVMLPLFEQDEWMESPPTAP